MGNCQLLCDEAQNKEPIQISVSQINKNKISQMLQQKPRYPISENVKQKLRSENIKFQYKEDEEHIGYYYLAEKDVCYEGILENFLPQGRGRVIFKDGSFLQGEFIQGVCEGNQCILATSRGQFYKGSFKNNKFHGEGKFNQGQYEFKGLWKQNIPNGKGKETFKGKAIYQGQFKSGIKESDNAIYYWLDSQIYQKYQGQFKNNEFNGNGKLYKKNGEVIAGYFKDGTIYKNLQINSPQLSFQSQNDKDRSGPLNGVGILKNNKGLSIEGNFQNGQLHGSETRDNRTYFWFKGKQLIKWKDVEEQSVQFMLRQIQNRIKTEKKIKYLQDIVVQLQLKLNSINQYKDYKVDIINDEEVDKRSTGRLLVVKLKDNIYIRFQAKKK